MMDSRNPSCIHGRPHLTKRPMLSNNTRVCSLQIVVLLYLLAPVQTGVYAQAPTTIWGYGAQLFVTDVATDAIGNYYVLSDFRGVVDLDPGPGLSIVSSVGGTVDICVVKFDADGVFQWGQSFGGAGSPFLSGDDKGIAIRIDQEGNVYFGGAYGSLGVTFGSGPNSTTITDALCIVTKLNPNGMFMWARGLQGVPPDAFPTTATLRRMDVDPLGYSICSIELGQLPGLIDIDPGSNVEIVQSPGNGGLLLWRLDPFGNLSWGKIIGGAPGTSTGFYAAVATDENGDVYIGGRFSGPVDFGTANAPLVLYSFGERDGFVCRFNPNGEAIWCKTISAMSASAALAIWSIEVKNEEVLMGGQFSESFDFDPGAALQSLTALGIGNIDGFLFKMSASGQYLWAHKLGDIVGYDTVHKVKLDEGGNAYATGQIKGTVDFNTGIGQATLSVGIDQANYVLKWGPESEYKWVFANYSTALNYEAICVDEFSLLLGGTYSSALTDIDPSTSEFFISGTTGWFGKYNQALTTELNTVSESVIEPSMAIRTNPGGGYWALHPVYSEPATMEIYDTRGRLMRSVFVQPGVDRTLFDISSVPPALYLARIIEPNEVIVRAKFIHVSDGRE